ncbi:potassium transporter [Marasmius fiardii PR-910]|nr:potassium transporter [Marasmius fiardii PR-910]
MPPPSLENNGRVKIKRKEVKKSGFGLALLSFQTLGIVYSDLGTSPLYVLNGIWHSGDPSPSKEDVIGGVSAIIWALTLLPLIKYVFITLKFATEEGEGGTFALYQGLYGSSSSRSKTKTSSSETSLMDRLRWPLLIWALFGTALTVADGILTPAVSVVAAISGIGVAHKGILSSLKPISIGIVILFFLWQRFGTWKIAITYGPIAFIWFVLLAVTGIWSICRYPGIFRAFDPSRAILFFVRTKNYELLAGVLLALTGCEAMFACVGHFNALSIQLSFTFFVYPALVLTYLGQGAALIAQAKPTVPDNIFYQTIPGPVNGPLFWIMFTMAILAAIIASQCLVTATFSLIQQLVSANCFLPLRIHHTSNTYQGQIYVPAANWSLMIVCIIVLAAFADIRSLYNAFGFAAATVMFTTSVMLAVQMHIVKRWPKIVGLVYLLTFGALDALFWGASCKKVPQGAWVPLMIGLLLTILMCLWAWGKTLEDRFDGKNVLELPGFAVEQDRALAQLAQELTLADDASGEHYAFYVPEVTENAAVRDMVGLSRVRARGDRDVKYDNRELMRIPTCAVFHRYVAGRGFPHAFSGTSFTFVSPFVRQWPGVPQALIFLSVTILPTPSVPEHERYLVSKLGSMEGFYSINYQLGFRDPFDVKVDNLLPALYSFEREHDPEYGDVAIERLKSVSGSLTHIVPQYNLKSRDVFGPSRGGFLLNWIRRYLIEDVYQRLSVMFPDTINWRTAPDQLVHVGIIAVI